MPWRAAWKDASSTNDQRRRALGSWVAVGEEPRPWEREAAAGEPELGKASERPEWIVSLVDDRVSGGDSRDLARAAGSERTGLKHVTVSPGKLSAPPHCHSAEEDLFVVLEGEGTLELTPAPGREPSPATEPAELDKVFLRGVGLIARLKPLGYWDGED